MGAESATAGTSRGAGPRITSVPVGRGERVDTASATCRPEGIVQMRVADYDLLKRNHRFAVLMARRDCHLHHVVLGKVRENLFAGARRQDMAEARLIKQWIKDEVNACWARMWKDLERLERAMIVTPGSTRGLGLPEPRKRSASVRSLNSPARPPPCPDNLRPVPPTRASGTAAPKAPTAAKGGTSPEEAGKGSKADTVPKAAASLKARGLPEVAAATPTATTPKRAVAEGHGRRSGDLPIQEEAAEEEGDAHNPEVSRTSMLTPISHNSSTWRRNNADDLMPTTAARASAGNGDGLGRSPSSGLGTATDFEFVEALASPKPWNSYSWTSLNCDADTDTGKKSETGKNTYDAVAGGGRDRGEHSSSWKDWESAAGATSAVPNATTNNSSSSSRSAAGSGWQNTNNETDGQDCSTWGQPAASSSCQTGNDNYFYASKYSWSNSGREGSWKDGASSWNSRRWRKGGEEGSSNWDDRNRPDRGEEDGGKWSSSW